MTIWLKEKTRMSRKANPVKSVLHDFDLGDPPVPAHHHPNGGGWVADTAKVSSTVDVDSTARVTGSPKISGTVTIQNYAWVSGAAIISGDSRIGGFAHVGGKAKVQGGAIYDRADVNGCAIIRDHAYVFHHAQVHGSAVLQDGAEVSGGAHVYGTAHLSGHAVVRGDAHVCTGNFAFSPFYLEGLCYSITHAGIGLLEIERSVRPYADWLKEDLNAFGKKWNYPKKGILELKRYLDIAIPLCRKQDRDLK